MRFISVEHVNLFFLLPSMVIMYDADGYCLTLNWLGYAIGLEL